MRVIRPNSRGAKTREWRGVRREADFRRPGSQPACLTVSHIQVAPQNRGEELRGTRFFALPAGVDLSWVKAAIKVDVSAALVASRRF